ncbi:MAG: hypothetical protein B1H06_05305 [Candidatus Cloacimonas sp. 4484_143]|nr:MAG: hypothetical protein B1H06_05305 [Candidatus Cloacimonas sp. 4484_143]
MCKKQILVVEDQAVVAENIRKILLSYGYEVPEPIPTGEEAIEAINKKHPDLILLDIMLKDKLSGIDVANYIIDMNIPIIYLTAYSDKNIIEEAKETGPFGYLIKPFRERELIATIKMAFFRHKMELELKESEEKFRTLVETTDEGICMFDKDEFFTFINEAGAKIFDDEISSFKEKNLSNYLNRYNSEILHKHNKLRKENKSSRYEMEIILKDGRKRILNIIGSPRFQDGNFIGTFAIFNDITEKRMADLKLKQTMASYTRIFENIQDIYYEIEFNGTILEMSPSIEHDSSYTRNELIGKSLYDLCYDEDQREFFLTKLTKDGDVYDYEIVLRDKDKTPLICTINAKIIKDEDTDKIRIIGSLKNITEQKESEAARQEYEKRYRKLFESSIDAVFLMDENSFLDCNNATLKLFGLTEKTDFLHLHPADISPEIQADKKSSRKTIDAHIYKTLKKGSMKFTWIYKKSTGETFPAEVWLNCLKLDNKSLIQGTIREINNN